MTPATSALSTSDRLVAVAKPYHVRVRVLRRVGHFVPAGVPLMMVSKGDRLPETGTAELPAAFDLRPDADAAAGCRVRRVADRRYCAERHLAGGQRSHHGHQLRRSVEPHPDSLRLARPPDDLLYDPPGIVRVSVRWIDFDRLLESAFEQIRHVFAKADVAVVFGCCARLATSPPRRPIRSTAACLSSRASGRSPAAPKSSAKRS